MTKFILHGGTTREINPDNNGFFREMTVDITGNILILLNYFSRDEHEVKNLAEQDKGKFLQNSENKNLAFEIARPETLIDQLQRSHVFYMRGGDTRKLVDALSKTPQLKELFRDKVVAGSSAGAYALAKYYWENDTGELGDGLGILNFKVFCHYKHKDKLDLVKLRGYKKDLPILTLPDYQWIVIYK